MEALREDFLSLTERGLQQEFQSLELESEAIGKPSQSDAKQPRNASRNRYKDILPFDYNRVPIDNEIDNDYINASFISMEDDLNQIMIASQGPLDGTTEDFWRMCWFHQIQRKCAKYYPTSEELPIETDQFFVKLISCELIYSDLFVRKLRLIQKKGEKDERLVTHVQYVGWPDYGVSGNLDKVTTIIHLMQAAARQSTSFSPVLVHCSAGCGRTGTIIVLLQIKDWIERNMQYNFVVQYVINALLNKKFDQAAKSPSSSRKMKLPQDAKDGSHSHHKRDKTPPAPDKPPRKDLSAPAPEPTRERHHKPQRPLSPPPSSRTARPAARMSRRESKDDNWLPTITLSPNNPFRDDVIVSVTPEEMSLQSKMASSRSFDNLAVSPNVDRKTMSLERDRSLSPSRTLGNIKKGILKRINRTLSPAPAPGSATAPTHTPAHTLASNENETVIVSQSQMKPSTSENLPISDEYISLADCD